MPARIKGRLIYEKIKTIQENKNDSEDKIAIYTSNNDLMNKAIVQAQKTYDSFLHQLKVGCEGCERFNVKMRFSYGDGDGEHLWIDSLYFKKEKLFGIVASMPEKPAGVNFGNIVEVKSEDISDWMFIKDNKLVGGYTIKVIFDDLTKEEKIQMQQDFGAVIE